MPYFGRNIRTAVFGQSHAAAIGVTIDGLPAGEAVDAVELEAFMARRAPEQNRMTTQRREADRPEILCGIVDGRTCGAPLTSIIRNGDTRSKDYAAIADLPRPSHADWPAHVRYGGWQDVRGGGAFSARLTAPLCIAGGIAMQILARRGIRIAAHVRSVGAAEDRPYDPMGESSETIEESLARSPVALSNEAAAAMAAEIEAARQEADSIGGTVECMISGLPVGLGGPLFEGLDGRIAQAVFAVPAVKSVEFGEGFGAALLRGSENNNPYGMREGAVTPLTNRAGGIASGMTTGMPVVFRVALKPTPSIGQSQHTVSLSGGCDADLRITGRHDPCVVVRAVPQQSSHLTPCSTPPPDYPTPPCAPPMKEELDMKQRFGLIGASLGHSLSPEIHAKLGGYPYDLIELTEDEVGPFLTSGDFQGLNVTIPYKKTVMKHCTELTPRAAAIGSVNTIVRLPDGGLLGDNTDYAGFAWMVKRAGLSPKGRNALVLGSGGASLTGCAVLRDLGAASVTTISRSGPDNYGNLDRHADAQLIVNTTPVGMHPTCDASPLETLEAFPALESVLDIIYNPACTELMLLARSRGLPTENGLSMLVMQAQAAAERFLGHALPDAAAEDILKDMTLQFSNLVLLGMPGSGKTKVARRLAELLHRPFVDVDELIVRKAGRSIPDIFARDGEAHFRDLESKVIEGFSAGHCLVVTTGGGSVLRERNRRLLQRNGLVLWLHRPLEELPSAGRPVSLARGVEAIFVEREPIFRALAHRIITSRRLRTQFGRSSEKSRETSDHQRPQHQFSGHSRTGHLRQHDLQGPVRNTRDLVRRCRRLMRTFPVQP